MIVVDSPPGITSPSRPVELLGQPNFDDVGAEPAQRLRVLAERPLERQNADAQRAVPSIGFSLIEFAG